jgi:hypothetical protein
MANGERRRVASSEQRAAKHGEWRVVLPSPPTFLPEGEGSAEGAFVDTLRANGEWREFVGARRCCGAAPLRGASHFSSLTPRFSLLFPHFSFHTTLALILGGPCGRRPCVPPAATSGGVLRRGEGRDAVRRQRGKLRGSVGASDARKGWGQWRGVRGQKKTGPSSEELGPVALLPEAAVAAALELRAH